MTITYSHEVSNVRFCGFAKLLARWKGSIYKLLYKEIISFCILYYSLRLIYWYLLSPSQKETFEDISRYCRYYIYLIPLSFILSLYIAFVVRRWFRQFSVIPNPHPLATLVSMYVEGHSERGRLIRRRLIRLINLMLVVFFRSISVPVKKRFPTIDHLVRAGLMTKKEKIMYEASPGENNKWLLPKNVFANLAHLAWKERHITSKYYLVHLMNELNTLHKKCGSLLDYDYFTVPLAFTYCVTLVSYTHFICLAMGLQFVGLDQTTLGFEYDKYLSVSAILQFLFYISLLKIAEQLLNPFGEDDDDVDLNLVIGRDYKIFLLDSDAMYKKVPNLIKEAYWNKLMLSLPSEKSTIKFQSEPHLGSAVNININPEESQFVWKETTQEIECEESNSDLFEIIIPNN